MLKFLVVAAVSVIVHLDWVTGRIRDALASGPTVLLSHLSRLWWVLEWMLLIVIVSLVIIGIVVVFTLVVTV